ncbi:hypothetical protein PAAG_00226 [Paracoccidioides lutzii Pb01]|uniref:Spo7-like protein n=1 Tax=Paracoccidioides lutzii (strain ATCC MYA-826 / Pb01) TaxID=502779 RepID=C1GNY1_PARBA|nr:hypothetical protein PAAG_00226 [Paracoccidioides lutzii Pb01]EEH35903.1 hypothetical protein PAAG_00226 [Paracoccidioides lutzii Pb01]
MSSRLDQIVKGAPSPRLSPVASLPGSTPPSPPLEPSLLPYNQQQHSPSPSPSLSPSPSPSIYPQPSPQENTAFPLPTATPPADPLSTLPSSPPQIYLNLLILESSLRSQYLALRARRRQNTFFLLLLACWVTYFAYALFLRPREDGRGVGGSVYWVVEMAEKVALMGGVVTGVLIWGTGQWERGVRWPRRWLVVANRGLRAMNTKIVVLRGPWWVEVWSWVGFLFPFPLLTGLGGVVQYVESTTTAFGGGGGGGGGGGEREKGKRSRATLSAAHPQQQQSSSYYSSYADEPFLTTHGETPPLPPGTTLVEEDINPGGDHIKLLLLPKSFSPAFRENWDEYRTDYWEKENERRALLRRKLKEQRRERARLQGGWLWWIRWLWGAKGVRGGGGRRLVTPLSGGGQHHHHQHGHGHGHSHHHHHHHHHHHRDSSISTAIATSSSSSTKRRSQHHSLHQHSDPTMPTTAQSHSRTSSRSTTPNRFSDHDDFSNNNGNGNGSNHERHRPRRGSSAASTSGNERKRRNKSASSLSDGGGGGGGGRRAPSPLARIEAEGLE